MRPRGPLPRRIYWTRRLLVVVGVLAMLILLWQLLPGDGGSGSASADLGAGSGGSRSPSRQPSSTPPTPPRAAASTQEPPAPTRKPPTKRPKPLPKTRPTGPCAPALVNLAVTADSAPPSEGTTVRYTLSTTDGSTCSLGITPALMETRITFLTGGEEQVAWLSSSCPDELPAKNVVVRPQPVMLYSFHWDATMTDGTCGGAGSVAAPGRYRVVAALIGGEPNGSFFFVTEPDLAAR